MRYYTCDVCGLALTEGDVRLLTMNFTDPLADNEEIAERDLCKKHFDMVHEWACTIAPGNRELPSA